MEPLEFLKIISEEWATVSAHPYPFIAALIIGLLFGWAGAWLILKQRIDQNQELVDHYRDVITEKIPGVPEVRLSNINRGQWRLVYVLILIWSLFTVIGTILSYSTIDTGHGLIGMSLTFFGVMLMISAIALAPIKPPDKQ